MMNKYLIAEKRLAELRGYKEIFRLTVDGVEHGGLHYNRSTFTGAEQVPRWCRDWNACGPLMVEYRCFPDTTNGDAEFNCVSARDMSNPHKRYVEYVEQHPDIDTAVRYAIVRALIAKLELEAAATAAH